MDGKVLVYLDVNPFRLKCNGNVEYISKLNKQFWLQYLTDIISINIF